MKQLKGPVKNFVRQYKRITTNTKQTTGKAEKHSEFEPYLTKLRETGGGNTSNLLCHGQKNTKLQSLYDDLATCKTVINNTCHADTLPTTNTTKMEACKAAMDAFEAKTQEARGKSLQPSDPRGEARDASQGWISNQLRVGPCSVHCVQLYLNQLNIY